MSRFARGLDFPNEGFVQQAIEKHFLESGFRPLNGRYADLICTHEKTREKWVVEAKGETTSIGLDFRTGLGQLLQRMDDPDVNYAIALPDIPQFNKQYKMLPTRVRQLLNLHILLVNVKGNVHVIKPTECFQ